MKGSIAAYRVLVGIAVCVLFLGVLAIAHKRMPHALATARQADQQTRQASEECDRPHDRCSSLNRGDESDKFPQIKRMRQNAHDWFQALDRKFAEPEAPGRGN